MSACAAPHVHDIVRANFIFSSAWLCQQSSWNRNSSVVCRPSSSLLNPSKPFLKFLLSGPDKSTVLDFWNFEFLIFQEFCSFSLTWDPMGDKTSKRYSSLKSLLTPFKLFLNFLLIGPHKGIVLDFWNFEFLIFHDFFFVFVHIEPYGSQKFKTQSTFESFQTFYEISYKLSSQKYFFRFVKF